MVFIDDSPFERGLVRRNLPSVTVAELPDDPSNYLEYLRNKNYFEVSSITKSDLEKTKLYKEEGQRKKSKMWNSMMRSVKEKRSDGKGFYTPAMFTQRYLLTTVLEKNAKGTD